MGHQFAQIAFTDTVRDIQTAMGSRAGYARMDDGEDYNHILSEREAGFISERDSFYMASVSETGWPYVQHRGGPTGFVKILDERTIGFTDYAGNRQYVSVGNFRHDDRVALFFMDYPNKTRLKMLGRVKVIESDHEDIASLDVEDYAAQIERGFVIKVEAFDWNCPQHITPRYTQNQVEQIIQPIVNENTAGVSVLGDGPMELVISGVRQLTPRIRAYEMRDPDGAELPPVKAGSHLVVPVMLANGETSVRHYSICSPPAHRDVYEIAVLREEDGEGGSVAVHQQFNIGMRLFCEKPDNYFELHNDTRPAVLIAAGIGITPIKSMAQTLKARGADMQLHYAGKSNAGMAFRDQLTRELGQQLSTYRSSRDEHMDVESILSNAPADAVFYACGPNRLIDAVSQAALTLGIESDRIRFERFTGDIDEEAKPIEVELERTGIVIQITPQQSILDGMLDAGIDVPFSCRTGNCRTCVVEVLDGEPDHRDSALSTFEKEQQQLMCPCVSRARTDKLVLDI